MTIDRDHARSAYYRLGTPAQSALGHAARSGGTDTIDSTNEPFVQALAGPTMVGPLVEITDGTYQLTPVGWEVFYEVSGYTPEQVGPGHPLPPVTWVAP